MGTYVGLRRKYGPVIPRLEAVQKRKTQNLTFSVRIKQTKMIFSLIGLVLLQSVEAKICWKECASDTSVLQNVNIEGCRRRASYPHRQRFRCEGTEGPPCIVERGSTVHLDVAWQNPGVTNMTQSTVWVSGWGIEIPWLGWRQKVVHTWILALDVVHLRRHDRAGSTSPFSSRRCIQQESTISSGSSTTETRWAKRLRSPAFSSRSRSSDTLRTQ